MRTKNRTVNDFDGISIPAFVIANGKTLTSPYTPDRDEVICLGNDVTITVNTIPVTYLEGTIVALKAGVVYILDVSTSIHYM